MNIVYIEPRFDKELAGGWDLSLRPRVWAYLFNSIKEHDFRKFRGNAGLAIGLEKAGGMGLVARGVANPKTGQGNLTVDLTFPLKSFDRPPYLIAQLFTGYGESLQTFDMRETRFRIGPALTR